MPQEFSKFNPCPCGSSRKYDICCSKKGAQYRVNDDGGIVQRFPLPPEAAAALRELGAEFRRRNGRLPRPDEPNFAEDEVPTKQQFVVEMEAAGVRPELIYAFEKTDRIVTEVNKGHLFMAYLPGSEADIDDFIAMPGEDCEEHHDAGHPKEGAAEGGFSRKSVPCGYADPPACDSINRSMTSPM